MNAKHVQQGNPAPEVSFEAAQDVINKYASCLVSMNIKVSLPLEDWINLARYAKAHNWTVERAVLEKGAFNPEVLDFSDACADELRAGRLPATPECDELGHPVTEPKRLTAAMDEEVVNRLREKAHRANIPLGQYLLELADRDIKGAKANQARKNGTGK